MIKMSKCPYCEANLSLKDFFVVTEKVSKKGKVKTRIGEFKGDSISTGVRRSVKMWACLGCDTILGFSEYDSDRSMH